MGTPALDIDFIRAPRRIGLAGVLALSFALLAVAWVAVDYRQAREEQQRLQARAARVQVSQTARERGMRAIEDSPQTRQALELLDAPWEALFDGVAQAAVRHQVGLLRFEADGNNRTLRLTAQARNFPAARLFVEQLQQVAPVTAVLLNSHEAAVDAGQAVLRFQVDVSWKVRP